MLDSLKINSSNVKGDRDNQLTDEVTGGLKTQELPLDLIPSSQLCSEVDINPELEEDQKRSIRKILMNNQRMFGLDGQLGNYDAKVEITLKPDTHPISLPPYNSSPANQKVIDNQMDTWIQLEVIEESRSPWGFPALISYKNGK
ncbi:hypothetical protein M422DRAFT_159118, partial [Sphaerobolus stellatus SS14]